MQVLPSVVKPVHPVQSAWQVLAWAKASAGQNFLLWAAEHVVSEAASQLPAAMEATVPALHSLQNPDEVVVAPVRRSPAVPPSCMPHVVCAWQFTLSMAAQVPDAQSQVPGVVVVPNTARLVPSYWLPLQAVTSLWC